MVDAKRPEHRQRRNIPAVLDGSGRSPAVPSAPRPPTGLSAPLRRAWRGLWDSPVAQLLDPVSDLPAVTRLYTLYALGERMDARIAIRTADPPSVDDEDSGPSLESMIATRVRVASECRLLEATLGLSPRARLALGLALLAGRKQGAGSLDDLADDANEE